MTHVDAPPARAADQSRDTPPRGSALAGVAAALVAVGVAELVAGLLPGGRSVIDAVGDRIIDLTPGPVVRFAIDVFGSANRLVLLTSVAVVIVGAGALVGIVAARRWAVAPASFAAFAVLAAAVGLNDSFMTPLSAIAAPAVGAVAGVLLLRWLLALAAVAVPASEDVQADPAAGTGARRRFLQMAGVATAAAATAGFMGRVLQRASEPAVRASAVSLPRPADSLPPPPASAALEVEGISPLITPNEDFYRIDTALFVPRIDASSHVVRVTGMVDRPFELTYAQLLEEADTEADVTLACVSNEVGGRLVGNARWQGVPLERLLRRAGVRLGADQVVGRAVDGWTAGFPLEVALDGRPALVAVGMNGEPLPARHGYPARLVIAGLYGYVSDTKWLSEIEVTTFDAVQGYWIPRGWAREGPIKTQSRIDVPRPGAQLPAGPTAIAGVAWAGERGIEAVEVSIDDGRWLPARLADELAETTWRQWVLTWDATPGQHTLKVRATDGDGETQTAERRPPAPDGATGHHTVRVTVT